MKTRFEKQIKKLDQTINQTAIDMLYVIYSQFLYGDNSQTEMFYDVTFDIEQLNSRNQKFGINKQYADVEDLFSEMHKLQLSNYKIQKIVKGNGFNFNIEIYGKLIACSFISKNKNIIGFNLDRNFVQYLIDNKIFTDIKNNF